MTVLYFDFMIQIPGNNIKIEAVKKLTCTKGKIKVMYALISPLTEEDAFILIARNQEQLCGEGLHHAAIDDLSHRIDLDVTLNAGDSLIAAAYGPNARTIYGAFAYEIIE